MGRKGELILPILAGFDKSGDGAPVLLIHGSMNSKSQWGQLRQDLSGGFTTLAVDLYGYGETPFPPDPENHSLMDEVALIRRTVDAALGGVLPVHVVAHSYGGMVALCHACNYPDEILSLTLFEPMANHVLLSHGSQQVFAEGQGLVDRIAALVEEEKPMEAANIFVSYFSNQGVFDMLPSKARNTLARYVPKMLIDYRTTIAPSLSIEAYLSIECPITLISGASSAALSKTIALILKDQVEQIRYIEVEGGHMAPITHPLSVNRIISNVLSDLSAQSTVRATG